MYIEIRGPSLDDQREVRRWCGLMPLCPTVHRGTFPDMLQFNIRHYNNIYYSITYLLNKSSQNTIIYLIPSKLTQNWLNVVRNKLSFSNLKIGRMWRKHYEWSQCTSLILWRSNCKVNGDLRIITPLKGLTLGKESQIIINISNHDIDF